MQKILYASVSRAVISAALLAGSAALATAEQLTVSVWAGSYGETWKRIVADPFAAKTGIDVVVDMGQSSQRLSKLLASAGGVDLMFITDHQMAVAKQRGLLQPVDPANVPNMENLYDFARDPLGDGMCPAITLLGVGLAYNKEHYATPPQTWSELFRDDLPAAAAFMDISFSVAPAVLVRLSEMFGGNIENIDPGLKALSDRIERIRFFNLFEVNDWINQGEVSVAPMLNTYVRIDPNVPLAFTFPEDGMIGVVNVACIPADAQNKEAAEKFLDFYLSAEVQTELAGVFGETPVVRGAEIPEGTPYVTISESTMESMTFYDPNVIASQRGAWMEKFEDAIIAQ